MTQNLVQHVRIVQPTARADMRNTIKKVCALTNPVPLINFNHPGCSSLFIACGYRLVSHRFKNYHFEIEWTLSDKLQLKTIFLMLGIVGNRLKYTGLVTDVFDPCDII